MPAGTHTLAVAARDGDIVVAPPLTLTAGGHQLTLEYTDNSATRRTGTLLGMTGGILAGVGGASATGRLGDGENTGLAILGLVSSGILIIVGTAMMLTDDTAVLRMDGEGESDGERWAVGERRETARAVSGFGPF